MAADAWNTCDREKVALAYMPDTSWRNRSEFLNGRDEMSNFPTRKWAQETGYRLIEELWSHGENRIAVRNASINDVVIAEAERLFHWPQRPRPRDHAGWSELRL